mgnify:CR=1 FL=1
MVRQALLGVVKIGFCIVASFHLTAVSLLGDCGFFIET